MLPEPGVPSNANHLGSKPESDAIRINTKMASPIKANRAVERNSRNPAAFPTASSLPTFKPTAPPIPSSPKPPREANDW